MLKRIFDSTFYSFLARGFFTLTNLAAIYYVSNTLDAASKGDYGIAHSYFFLFSVLVSFGVFLYFSKEIAVKRESGGELFSEFLTLSIYGIIISLPVCFLIKVLMPQLPESYLILSFLTGILLGLEVNLGGFVLGFENARLEATLQGAGAVIYILLLVSSLSDPSVLKVIVFRIMVSSVTVAVRFVYVKRKFPVLKLKAKLKYWKDEKYYYFISVAEYLYRHADTPIMGLYFTREMTGDYFIAVKIYFFFAIIPEAVTIALTPYVSRIYQGEEKVAAEKILSRVFLLAFGTGVPLGCLLYYSAGVLTGIIGGDQVILQLLAFAVPLRIISQIVGLVFSATEFQKSRFYLDLWIYSSFCIIAVVLINIMGPMGAVWSRIVIDLMAVVLYCIVIVRKMGKQSGFEYSMR